MIRNWQENFYPVWLVASRELRDQFRDWRILLPMIILTLVVPFLGNAGARAAINFTTQYGTPLIAERLVPFILLVVGFFPVTVSLVIALEAFVGEKERGTIEPLLVSPLEDWQIYLGKLLAGTVAPLMTSYLGIIVYLIGLVWQDIALPDANRMAQTLTLTTVQAFLMVSAAILISTQSTSVRAANLMASFIIIPMALLLQGEAVLLFWGNNQVLWLAVLGVFVLTVLLARVGISHFQREALLGREIDALNLRWVAQVFWQTFRGQAKSLGAWYRYEIFAALQRQRISILLTTIIGLLGIVSGYLLVQEYRAYITEERTIQELSQVIPSSVNVLSPGWSPFLYILGHNLRATVFIFLIGLASFGTLSMLTYLLNTAIVGAVLSLTNVIGLSAWRVGLFGLLPHGIFELPALVLSASCVFYIAIILVTPRNNKSLSEATIEAIAESARIFVGIIFPLFILAAAIETWVTPVLLSNYL